MNSLADILNQKADELFESDSTVSPASNRPLEQTNTAPAPDQTGELRKMIYSVKDQLDAMLRLLDGEKKNMPGETTRSGVLPDTSERILEGAFMGEKMLGDDGKEYAVPPNYASKSKLVCGDRMKLTITRSGSFIFKQIGPVDRKREIGKLVNDLDGDQWAARVGDTTYRILTASVTFYKGKPDDEVIVILPRDGHASWGAVDNIIAA